MDQIFHLFVLQKQSHRSHGYVGELELPVDVESANLDSLENHVRNYIQSHQEFQSLGERADDIEFTVHQLPISLLDVGEKERAEIADRGQLDKDSVRVSGIDLRTLGSSPELIFVFEATTFRFVVFDTLASSYDCLTVGSAITLPKERVDVIEQAARDCLKARFSSHLIFDVRVREPKDPFSLDDPLTPHSRTLLNKQAKEFIKRSRHRGSAEPLKNIIQRDHLIITFTLRFKFVSFNAASSPYTFICSGEVVARSHDPIRFIVEAAEELSELNVRSEGGPEDKISINSFEVYEPTNLYKEAYEKTIEQMEDLVLNEHKFAKWSHFVKPLSPGDAVKGISSPNLIIRCVAIRRFQINRMLFERRPGSYQFCGHEDLDASSDQSMRVIWDNVQNHLEMFPKYFKIAGRRIQVYEPTESFDELYRVSTKDLGELELEEHHFQANPAKLNILSPRGRLSDVNASRKLIVVFDFPPPPQPALSDMFLRLKLVNETPSIVSEDYRALQMQPKERILDDRPRRDSFVPPLSLLYDGFGLFHDVIYQTSAVPESNIHENQLWDEVESFAKEQVKFYDTEADREWVVRDQLERIFRTSGDLLALGEVHPSRIGSTGIISQGQLEGRHGAMVFCLVCKNEMTSISSHPSAELVSYIAHSFKEQLNGDHRALFHGWRAPALGMIQIGPYVQFVGVVMLTQMRFVALTPMLQLNSGLNNHRSRLQLYLAFKAASMFLAKIQDDVLNLILECPPEIPFESRWLPSVTKIESVKFALLRRYDTEVVGRELYLARVTPTNEEIYVKFSRRYSRELHVFCADRGLAPEPLGFERLPGEWFGIAMRKIEVVDPCEIESFPELDTWKKDIRKLVDDFHEEGLVHGDLRLENFIFTESSPRKMMLVDFDWGGKVGEARFPRGALPEELWPQGKKPQRLDELIAEEDDDRVLAKVFEQLDDLAARRVAGGSGMKT